MQADLCRLSVVLIKSELVESIFFNNSLKFCDSITVEVSTENFYEKGSKYDDVKEFLNDINFKVIKDPKRNHEDVVFIKNNLL